MSASACHGGSVEKWCGVIAKNVASVSDAAKQASSGAAETLKAASELARMAAELHQAMARFRT